MLIFVLVSQHVQVKVLAENAIIIMHFEVVGRVLSPGFTLISVIRNTLFNLFPVG